MTISENEEIPTCSGNSLSSLLANFYSWCNSRKGVLLQYVVHELLAWAGGKGIFKSVLYLQNTMEWVNRQTLKKSCRQLLKGTKTSQYPKNC